MGVTVDEVILVIGVRVTGVMADGVTMGLEVRVTGIMVDEVILVPGVRVMGVMVDEVILVPGVRVTGVRVGIADSTFFSDPLHFSISDKSESASLTLNNFGCFNIQKS
jgi:hypothetical protein